MCYLKKKKLLTKREKNKLPQKKSQPLPLDIKWSISYQREIERETHEFILIKVITLCYCLVIHNISAFTICQNVVNAVKRDKNGIRNISFHLTLSIMLLPFLVDQKGVVR